jgi:DNA repair protein RecN (Recombination protein N)
MLTYLKIRNLAIVEELAVEPGPGLNVLTGETGAGKSLLIDSLDLLGGARGSSESIRTGEEKLSVEAVFHLPAALGPLLEEAGIETESDGPLELIIRRELAAGGRGRILVNGSPMTARDLSKAMEPVLEIHGQNESNHRIAGKSFCDVLDEFGGHAGEVTATAASFRQWKETAEELGKLAEAQKELSLRLDLLKYQIEELTAANLEEGEEDALRSEKSVLAHAREMIESTAGAYALLDGDEDSALTRVGRAGHLLSPLTGSISEIRRLDEELQEARYRIEEIARTLIHLSETVRHDPARLEEIEERLVAIERLKKKYGGSLAAAIEHLGAIRREHETLADYENNLDKLQNAEARSFALYRQYAEALSQLRRQSGIRFERSIQKELDDLAMEGTTVRLQVGVSSSAASRFRLGEQGVAFGPWGFDEVEILIAPNRGEEPRPMQRIASGGELSRIQLAIATALFHQSAQSAAATLVFDEIDSGIGGRVAEAVGNKLRQLATTNQVICVTHLPQIASLGTTHFRVWKEEIEGRTRARVDRLDDREARVDEIARMLGGAVITSSARAHATELLRRGEMDVTRKRDRGRAVRG